MSSDIISEWTDAYFHRTRQIVEKFDDGMVTYAVFLRRPVLSAPRLVLDWLEQAAKDRDFTYQVDLQYQEGELVEGNEPLFYLTGWFSQLVELETLFLQRVGPPCVAAYNVWQMCMALPDVDFLAMDARHCAGLEMAEIMAYAASVGSDRAKREGAKGFLGNATNATAHYFGQPKGMGTMPHALIGHAGSTLRAAQMYHATFPDEPMTVLVDYFGQEISDSLEVAHHFPELAAAGRLSFRLDTPGSRFCEGVEGEAGRIVLMRHVAEIFDGALTEKEQHYLMGSGVSAAAIWRLREVLDKAGFTRVRIVASSGFNMEKCAVMARAKAPVDVVGTGSYLPNIWSETYATADIVNYDGVPRVKKSREFLLRK